MRELDDEDMEELESLFDMSDSDGNGRIDFAEFRQLLADLDPEMGMEEIEVGFREIDANGNGDIDFEEFSEWWLER